MCNWACHYGGISKWNFCLHRMQIRWSQKQIGSVNMQYSTITSKTELSSVWIVKKNEHLCNPRKTIEKWGNIKCEFLLPACTQCTLLSNTSYPHKRINSSGFGKSQNIDPKSVMVFLRFTSFFRHIRENLNTWIVI